MIFRFLSAALVISAALPARAAEDAPLPPLTPKGEYLVMTQDDATSSSKCIGSPATPMCAVETEMACRVRANFELCRIGMGLDTDEHINKGSRQYPKLYQVVRREILTGQDFPWEPTDDVPWRPGEISMKAGDIRIDIVTRDCEGRITPSDCELPLYTLAYIVRRQGERWAVIEAEDPNDPRNR